MSDKNITWACVCVLLGSLILKSYEHNKVPPVSISSLVETYERAIVASAENGYLRGRTYQLQLDHGLDASTNTVERVTNEIYLHFHH